MAKVNFIRRHTDAEVISEPIVDGNFIVTGDGNIYIDYGLERIKIVGGGGGSATGDTLPIGSITAYGKETAPANWLICDGSAISRKDYADLFAVIGTKYGEGDGSTTFNLPNLKGRVPVGLDSDDTDFGTIGKTDGEKTHKLIVEEIPSHTHTMYLSGGETPNRQAVNWNTQEYQEFSGITKANDNISGGDQPHNNLQPYQVNNFIIKSFQSAGVVANVVKTKAESDNDVYSCNYVNDAINEVKGIAIKKIATAQLNASLIDITAPQIIAMDNIVSNTTLLTLENGGIKIGAGISKVLVSANYFGIKSTNELYMWTSIKNGANEVSISITPGIVNFGAVVHSPKTIEVNEGDIIYLYKKDDFKTTIRGDNSNTWLTVEIIE